MINSANSGAIHPMTAEELLRFKPANRRSELIRGRLIACEPAGYRHGEIAARLGRLIGNYADERSLGVVVAAETGFKIASDPDTVRAPDVGFISKRRLPRPRPAGFAEMAPDLVVEVLSPEDRPREVRAKVGDWLAADCQLVWVIDPQRSVARIYRADGSENTVRVGGHLDGETVLPGFVVTVSDILGPPDESDVP
jgi:Uma2 family endonuclease